MGDYHRPHRDAGAQAHLRQRIPMAQQPQAGDPWNDEQGQGIIERLPFEDFHGVS